MGSKLFKYAVLVTCAALGITQAAIVVAGLPAPALSTIMQCPFQPDGYFYLNEPKPASFDDFDHIGLWVTGKKGAPRLAASRLYTSAGKSYKFAKLVTSGAQAGEWGIPFQFETEPIGGMSYQFSGKFITVCVYAQEKSDPTRVVAKGRMTKLKNGEEVATADVQFTYSRSHRPGAMAQESIRYPQDATDVITFVESFSQADFSVTDVIKNLGTTNLSNYDGKDGSLLLTPFPSTQTKTKRVVLDVFESKPNRATIEYIDPILISYSTLKEKYGSPRNLAPPVVHCARGLDCQPAFVGYTFSFIPDPESKTSGKRVEVDVDLTMEWSKVVPQPMYNDFLEVKEIRFRRVQR